MRNMKKKGFTLVELLVVIAIIAILAAVSVVGYTAFISRANESNAVTELSQIRDAVNASVLDGKESVTVDADTDYVVDFTYTNGVLTAKVGEEAADADEVKAAILTLTEMDGANLVATVDANGVVSAVDYTYGDVEVTWTVATGEIK